MMDFDYPSGKNQRFLPPPLTRGGFRGAVVIGAINCNLNHKRQKKVRPIPERTFKIMN